MTCQKQYPHRSKCVIHIKKNRHIVTFFFTKNEKEKQIYSKNKIDGLIL